MSFGNCVAVTDNLKFQQFVMKISCHKFVGIFDFVRKLLVDETLTNALYHTWIPYNTLRSFLFLVLMTSTNTMKTKTVFIDTLFQNCTSIQVAMWNTHFDYFYFIIDYQNMFLQDNSLARGCLTHWGRDKIDAISQTTFLSAFSSSNQIPIVHNPGLDCYDI